MWLGRKPAARTGSVMALAAENAELREQLASVQDMLVETAIDAGNMPALVEAMRTERDAWQEQAERLRAQAMRRASHFASRLGPGYLNSVAGSTSSERG